MNKITQLPDVPFEFFQLRHPFSAIFAGPSGCGKTFTLRELLHRWRETISIKPEQMKDGKTMRVLFCYGSLQLAFKEKLNVHIDYHEGLADLDQIKQYDLIVIDDLLMQLAKNEKLANLFTRDVHHEALSVVFTMQNIYQKSDILRLVNLNAHYLFVFKNIRDKTQIQVLARQFMPENVKNFINVCVSAWNTKYGCLLIDCKPDTPDEIRLRTYKIPQDREASIDVVLFVPKDVEKNIDPAEEVKHLGRSQEQENSARTI